MIHDYYKLARPYQYTKNLFIFLPLFFYFQITNIELLTSALYAFISFSLLASAVYVFNDWLDRHDDAQHPTKKNRPIASGRIGFKSAALFFAVLTVSGFLLSYSINIQVFLIMLGYFLLNIAYTLKLKHIPILDVTVIAIGFVIRLFVGAFATGVLLSNWIIVMTFLLALFMALAKRRDDVVIYMKTQQKMRKVIDGYNLKFLDVSITISATIVMVSYLMWSMSNEIIEKLDNNYVYLTSIFVFLGIMRYMQITFVEEKSENPSKILLKDGFIQAVVLIWFCVFSIIIYKPF